MLLERGRAFAVLLAFKAAVIKGLPGLLVHIPGTVLGNSVLHEISLGMSAIITILAIVGPILLMLPIHMFL